MIEKKFKNVDLGVEITSFIDKQQNIFLLEKMLLKFYVIVKQEMHYQGMLIRRIKS